MSRTRRPNIILPKPEPSTPAETVPVVQWNEPQFEINMVVQCVAGEHRGWLGIIGAIEGDKIKLYSILPIQKSIAAVDVNASDIAVIGKAKVASRNAFNPKKEEVPHLREDTEDPMQ